MGKLCRGWVFKTLASLAVAATLLTTLLVSCISAETKARLGEAERNVTRLRAENVAAKDSTDTVKAEFAKLLAEAEANLKAVQQEAADERKASAAGIGSQILGGVAPLTSQVPFAPQVLTLLAAALSAAKDKYTKNGATPA